MWREAEVLDPYKGRDESGGKLSSHHAAGLSLLAIGLCQSSSCICTRAGTKSLIGFATVPLSGRQMAPALSKAQHAWPSLAPGDLKTRCLLPSPKHLMPGQGERGRTASLSVPTWEPNTAQFVFQLDRRWPGLLLPLHTAQLGACLPCPGPFCSPPALFCLAPGTDCPGFHPLFP